MQIVDKTHASKGQDNTRINNEIRSNLSLNTITVSLKYVQMKPEKNITNLS